MINFLDRFQEVGLEFSLCQGEGLIIMTFKRKYVGHDAVILTISLPESSTYCMDP